MCLICGHLITHWSQFRMAVARYTCIPNIVRPHIVFGFEELNAVRVAKVVSTREILGRKLPARCPCVLAAPQLLLVEFNFSIGLPIQEKNVAVQARTLGWPGANVAEEVLTSAHVAALDVDSNPVHPLAKFWVGTRWCVRVDQHQCVKVSLILCHEFHLGLIVHLARLECDARVPLTK